MEILGVGPLELLFIFLIALIFLGPNDMVKTGRSLGRLMRKVVTSDAWREITKLRTLPNQLMREAGLEEEMKELKELQKDLPKTFDLKDTDISSDLQQAINQSNSGQGNDLSAWTEPPTTEADLPMIASVNTEDGPQSGRLDPTESSDDPQLQETSSP